MKHIMSQLKPQKGARKPMKRVGRGDGSGHGGTSGRGHKGQLARSSAHVPRGFEGGQMPLQRRSPKWGFTSRNRLVYSVVNIEKLAEAFSEGMEVAPESCQKHGLVKDSKKPLKILGKGSLSKKLNVSAHAFSESAKASIEKAQGTCTVLTLKKASSA